MASFPRTYGLVRGGSAETATVYGTEALLSLRTELELIRRFGLGATPETLTALEARRGVLTAALAPTVRRQRQDIEDMRHILEDAMDPANALALACIDADHPGLIEAIDMAHINNESRKFHKDVSDQLRQAPVPDADELADAFSRAMDQVHETGDPGASDPATAQPVGEAVEPRVVDAAELAVDAVEDNLADADELLAAAEADQDLMAVLAEVAAAEEDAHAASSTAFTSDACDEEMEPAEVEDLAGETESAELEDVGSDSPMLKLVPGAESATDESAEAAPADEEPSIDDVVAELDALARDFTKADEDIKQVQELLPVTDPDHDELSQVLASLDLDATTDAEDPSGQIDPVMAISPEPMADVSAEASIESSAADAAAPVEAVEQEMPSDPQAMDDSGDASDLFAEIGMAAEHAADAADASAMEAIDDSAVTQAVQDESTMTEDPSTGESVVTFEQLVAQADEAVMPGASQADVFADLLNEPAQIPVAAGPETSVAPETADQAADAMTPSEPECAEQSTVHSAPASAEPVGAAEPADISWSIADSATASVPGNPVACARREARAVRALRDAFVRQCDQLADLFEQVARREQQLDAGRDAMKNWQEALNASLSASEHFQAAQAQVDQLKSSQMQAVAQAESARQHWSQAHQQALAAGRRATGQA